jgi:hypothetical protein
MHGPRSQIKRFEIVFFTIDAADPPTTSSEGDSDEEDTDTPLAALRLQVPLAEYASIDNRVVTTQPMTDEDIEDTIQAIYVTNVIDLKKKTLLMNILLESTVNQKCIL